MYHDGPFDVWLLDEGNDPDVKAMCARLGVNHFSRKGRGVHPESGAYKAKTKHGNYNAWLDCHGDGYDVWARVDTDHVPQPNFSERLLGYFRDPDVRSSSARRSTATTTTWSPAGRVPAVPLPRGHPAGRQPSTASAMFVGTNNAVRIEALQAIGGLPDSITEDAATSIEWHKSKTRGPAALEAVYTPDVLAVGEGPKLVVAYFLQQGRWARGTDEVILRRFWSGGAQAVLHPALHYSLLMSYYPSAALSWILGCFNLSPLPADRVGGVVVGAAPPVVHALHQRRGPADRHLLLEPSQQRQPARGERLLGRSRDVRLRAVGADVRRCAALRTA